MPDFELKDLGEGRFSLAGEMTFETAERILLASEEPFEQHTRIEVDLSGVDNLGEPHGSRDSFPIDARTRTGDCENDGG